MPKSFISCPIGSMLPGPSHIRNLKDGFSSALPPPPFPPPPSHPTSPDSKTCSVVPVLDRIPVMEQKENLSCLFLAENRKVLKINYCLCLLRHKTYLSGRLITAGCNSLRAPVFPPSPLPLLLYCQNMTVRIILLLRDITLQYHQGLCSSIQILIFRDSEIMKGSYF